MLSKNMSAMVGMKFGVNMLRADPRLWVPVSSNYKGFAFKPTKGWLAYGTAQTKQEHNGRNRKTSSSSRGMQTTSTDVRT